MSRILKQLIKKEPDLKLVAPDEPSKEPLSHSSSHTSSSDNVIPIKTQATPNPDLCTKKKHSLGKSQKLILALGLMISILYGFRMLTRNSKPLPGVTISAPPVESEPEQPQFKDDEKMNRDAITQFQSGNFKTALEMFTKLANRHPSSSSAHTNLGLTFFRLGNFEQAKKNLEAAIELNPRDAVAYNNLGIVVLKFGNAESAIRYFKKAVELNPTFADSHLNLGKTLEQSGRPEDAVASYRSYNQLVSADPVVKKLLERRIRKLNSLSRYYEKTSKGGSS